MATPKIKLNNGVEIPVIGLGTWQSKPDEVIHAVEYALKEAGYRHIDCAWLVFRLIEAVIFVNGANWYAFRGYDNEKEVGEGIRRSGVPRSDIFLTSKLWCTHHHRVEAALDETLANLGTDYLDRKYRISTLSLAHLPLRIFFTVYLVHWPIHLNPKGNHPKFPTRPDGSRDVLTDWKIRDTWAQMEAVLAKGKVRAIGVSNFSERVLEQDLLPYAKVVPAVDQVELHLYNPQLKLVKYLKSKGIVPQAYSPLGSTNSPLLQDETASALAKKYGLSTADVLLGYLVAKDIVTLPKSVTPARIKSNIQGALAAAKKLKEEDIEKLDGVAASGKQMRLIQPPWGVDLGFDNWPVRVQTK
ncbi:Aldo/keto reductase [Trametes punicea]|nr:Aldo/keto reductase [Trametes punicea]